MKTLHFHLNTLHHFNFKFIGYDYRVDSCLDCHVIDTAIIMMGQIALIPRLNYIVMLVLEIVSAITFLSVIIILGFAIFIAISLCFGIPF